MKKIFLVLMVILLLTGCGKNEGQDPAADDNTQDTNDTTTDNNSSNDDASTADDVVDYPFDYNGVTIHMNTEATPVVEALGEPLDYFEGPSCAFQGLDKIYYYNGFELSTYPMDGVDYIYAVDFKDDSVATKEGIYIGSSVEDMTTVYGDDYSEESGAYTYTLGESLLTFLTENNEIVAVTYMANVLE